MKKIVLGLMVLSAPSAAFADFDCKATQGNMALHVELNGATKIGYVTVFEGNGSSLIQGPFTSETYESDYFGDKVTIDFTNQVGKLDLVAKPKVCGRAGCWEDESSAKYKGKWSGKQGDTWFSCDEAK